MTPFEEEMVKVKGGKKPNPERSGLEIWQSAVLRMYLKAK
jgi:hypothetical protein